VHVPKSRDQKLAGGMDYARAIRNFDGVAGADCGDTALHDHNRRIRMGGCAGAVDDGDMGYGESCMFLSE
jgi:hypothetical protein